MVDTTALRRRHSTGLLVSIRDGEIVPAVSWSYKQSWNKMFHEKLFLFHDSKGPRDAWVADEQYCSCEKGSDGSLYAHTNTGEWQSIKQMESLMRLPVSWLGIARIPTRQQSHHLLSMIYVSFVSKRHIEKPFIARHLKQQNAMRGSWQNKISENQMKSNKQGDLVEHNMV
jgi:hypothetical protein